MMIRRNLGFAWGAVAALGLAALLVAACDSVETQGEYPNRPQSRAGGPVPGEKGRESIFGDQGLTIIGREKKSNLPGGGGGGGGIGVNSYLWRASLDTISFMPVNSADPFGGVIITDWHSSADTPDERFKMNVYILGRALRADGVRVALFRQVRQSATDWVDAPVPDTAATRIEDAILSRARQLRNETLQQ
ncbi:MAG: DUF3576 domain-containing protein [Hyphomicrobiales bacterium]|nr:DUF3576 domain-containing protein [Hyphomicrobiales bacterium]MCP5370475.1 DUF3576 domain-containing protein [Hyphomicrobiales bacterium]